MTPTVGIIQRHGSFSHVRVIDLIIGLIDEVGDKNV